MSNPISTRCPKCKSVLKLKSAAAVGKKVPCPKCQHPFIVKPLAKKSKPAPPAEDDFLNGLDEYEDDYGEAALPPMPSRKRSSKKSSKKKKSQPAIWKNPGVVIGGSVVGVLLIVGVVLLASGVFSSKAPADGKSTEVADAVRDAVNKSKQRSGNQETNQGTEQTAQQSGKQVNLASALSGTWFRKDERTLHALVQNETHWIEIETVLVPGGFPPLPAGFPRSVTGGAHVFNGNSITRYRKWQPHWREEEANLYELRQVTDGPHLTLVPINSDEHEPTTWGPFPNGWPTNPNSPLIGTWQIDGEDKFLLANGSSMLFLSGNTGKRLTSIKAGPYVLNGDHLIFTKNCDYKPRGIGKATRYHFEINGNTLKLQQVSDRGGQSEATVWRLLGPDPALRNATASASVANQQVADSQRDLNTAKQYRRRAQLNRGNGDSNKVLSDLSGATQPELDTPEQYLERAMDHYRKRDYAKSHADLSQAIRLDPANWRAHHLRGDLRIAIGEFEHAIADYTKSIQLNPDYPSNYYDRALTYVQHLQEFDKAIADYNEYIERAPDAADGYSGRAIVYYFTDKLEQALDDLNTSIELDNQSALAFRYRARVFLKKREADQAIRDLSVAIELPAPALTGTTTTEAGVTELPEGKVFVYYLRATAYYQKRDPENVIADCTKAIELNPSLVPAYYLRGQVYLKIGKQIEAQSDLNKAKSLAKR